ncbi:hypothetical protein GV794_09600 [Nocardia cyriacigeorgica]|uniref:Uncharacterized protein n=1 Tax=Nocardia cyriacigeorgica TaxID=135487 RepID=A0A6P1D8H3_9NOCA|nr:hypothetical protein [Nocardia cyriacigeorgica]NEW42131.1 hypothetical protein [Nocardia cyriacigeorgica]NEW44532.1 hypothetical protein [Nocardia cyriacigeorgica]NEW53149.1 hypothetical protein [Nocardia cyriacigeorgica]NEW55908.1 hypothetical protein [Nocardia cyriacigeorgica]
MNAFVAVMALAIAAAFLSMPIVRNRYGRGAMVQAQSELARQGVRTTALSEHGMRFDASGHESAAPISIAAILIALAGANLAGADWVRPVNWAVLILVLLGNAVIVYSNLTAVRSVQAAFERKGDPELARIDVPALLKAAEAGFPAWTWTLQNVRNVVVFGAALLGLVVMAVS